MASTEIESFPTASSYRRTTYDSLNPLIRFAHRTRLKKALRLVDAKPGETVFDYGCGDALFLRHMADIGPKGVQYFGFEPFMLGQEGSDTVQILRTREELLDKFANRKVDVATCFEVLEHCSLERQHEAMATVRDMLAPSGRFIVSVPIEFGFPALPKNLFRWISQKEHRKDLYTARNFWRSFVGAPIPEWRTHADFLGHMGFYTWDLEEVIKPYFNIVEKSFSPLPGLGASLNSQVFYLLKKR